MNSARTLAVARASARSLSVAMLAAGLLLLAAACGSEPATPMDASVDDVLEATAVNLAAISTARFQVIDEQESGAKFFGMTLKGVDGAIKTPDSFEMKVDLINAGLGFVEIEMVGVRELAYMKFAADSPWVPLPLDQVPFKFAGIGVTLADLLPSIQDPEIAGQESLGGVQTLTITGGIVSEDLLPLITDVDSGYPIDLTMWIDPAAHQLKQLRIDGQIYDDDAPETSRLVIISDLNTPVDIQLPSLSAGS